MSTAALSHKNLVVALIVRVGLFIPVMMLVLFVPAGTLAYWQGWIYLLVLLVPALAIFPWLLKNSPDLLANRMRMREKNTTQQWVVSLSWLFLVAAYVVPGLDYRWGWSNTSWPVVIAADVLVVASYLFVLWVFRVNRFASRVVEVTQAQRVIDTGPYAWMRHPMYTGAIVMYLASPIALGSYWAVLPALLIVPILVVRIIDEEATLRRELPGYAAYMEHVRYRLLPGVW